MWAAGPPEVEMPQAAEGPVHTRCRAAHATCSNATGCRYRAERGDQKKEPPKPEPNGAKAAAASQSPEDEGRHATLLEREA